MMSDQSIVCPWHYSIVRREGTKWYFKKGTVFYNPRNVPLLWEDRIHRYGLTDTQIVVELFRINGGKPGYYMANLRDREYHYCGFDWEDIQTTLRSLGIGRVDPIGG
jgi:FMN phosphatase YigB (HAD superfamily)